MYALSKFSQWPEAAKFVTAAGTMEYVVDLLHSPDHETRRWTCEMLENLLTHGYTSVSLGAGPCARIVGFLRCLGCH
jgi:hypothetical protein